MQKKSGAMEDTTCYKLHLSAEIFKKLIYCIFIFICIIITVIIAEALFSNLMAPNTLKKTTKKHR